MEAGVFNISSKLLIKGGITIIINSEITAVKIILVPMVLDNSSLDFAPKYWDTIIPTPAEIPTKSTRSILKRGVALPTAASALSPT